MHELNAGQKQPSAAPVQEEGGAAEPVERDHDTHAAPGMAESRLTTLAKLQESTRLNMILLDSIPHPAMLVRSDATILAANQIAKDMGARIGEKCWWEFSPAELRGHPSPGCPGGVGTIDTTPEGRSSAGICCLQSPILPGETIRISDRTAFGRIWDIRWIPVDEEKYLHYAVDTTEFRLAEERIRTSAARFRELFNHFTSGGAILEPISNGRVFIITDFNRNAEKICHVTKTEAIGRDILQVLPQLEKLEGMRMLEKVWRTGEAEHMSLVRDASGHPQQSLDLSVFKLPSGELVVIFDDVTEKRRADQALKNSEAYYRAVVEDQTELISRFKPDGTLTFVNQAYCRYFGERFEDLVGNQFWHHLPRTDRRRLKRHISKLTAENPVSTIQHEIVTSSGERRYLQWTDRAIFSEHGEIIEYQAVGLDITKRRRAEESARAQTRRIDTLNRIILWANKSHDLLSLLRKFLDSSLELMNFDVGAIHLVNRNKRTAELKCARGLQREFVENIRNLQIGEAPFNKVFLKQKPIVHNELKEELGPLNGSLRNYGHHSLAIVPLLTDNRVIGSLFIARKAEHTFTLEEKRTLQSIGREMGTAIRKMQTEEALRESEKKSRFLSTQLLAAQERERQRISKELHDELGQSLLILKLQLRQVEKKLDGDASNLKESCRNILHYIDEIVDNVRRLSRDLRPAILEDLGMSAAVRRLVKDFSQHNEIECRSEMCDLDDSFTPDEQISIYRILQESLTNVAKYAQASRVSIDIVRRDNGIVFIIEDDGKGFDVPRVMGAKTTDRGLGFAAMHERARMLSGCLEVKSAEGRGTRISLFVPHERGREN